jgi:membrane fusion protein (multidrug efflux system)
MFAIRATLPEVSASLAAADFWGTRMKAFLAILFGACFAHAAGAQSPSAPVSGAGAGEAKPPTPSAQAAPAAGGPLECLVEPHLVVHVGSAVDGVLEQVLVNRGDRVRKGQVVAKLQSGVESATLKLSQARVEFGRRKVERNEELFTKQLISALEWDELVTEVKLREQEVKRDEETLKLRTILSPIDGVVVERRLTPGEFIRTEKSVVLKLAQVDPLNVEVVVPAGYFKSLRAGMAGTVSFEPYLSGSYRATVVVVDQVVDAASGTLGVRLQLPNPNNRIPAGIKCSVVFRK